MASKYRCKRCGCKFAENTFPFLVVCPNCHSRWVQYEGVVKGVLLLLIVVALSLTMVLAQEAAPPLEVKIDLSKAESSDFTLLIKNPVEVDAEFSFAPKGFTTYDTNESTNIVTTMLSDAIYTLKPGEEKPTGFRISEIPATGKYRGYITMTVKAGTEQVSIDREIVLDVTQSTPGEVLSDPSGWEITILLIFSVILIYLVYRFVRREKLKKFKQKNSIQNKK